MALTLRGNDFFNQMRLNLCLCISKNYHIKVMIYSLDRHV